MLDVPGIRSCLNRAGFEIEESAGAGLLKLRVASPDSSWHVYLTPDEQTGFFEQLSFLLLWRVDEADKKLERLNEFNARSLLGRAYARDGYIELRYRLEVSQSELTESTFERTTALWAQDVAALDALV